MSETFALSVVVPDVGALLLLVGDRDHEHRVRHGRIAAIVDQDGRRRIHQNRGPFLVSQNKRPRLHLVKKETVLEPNPQIRWRPEP